VRDLQAWVSGSSLVEGHPFGAIRAHPTGPTHPELWILGSSDYGAQLAAHFGLPYAFAYFFSEGRGVEEALRLYRQNYRPVPSIRRRRRRSAHGRWPPIRRRKRGVSSKRAGIGVSGSSRAFAPR
jgi:alkanesulfonate monooxygenase SsuD/methylene tetrahydromethanopterin reductase-like flavin-dependent oxidoreductase (luciferase family)